MGNSYKVMRTSLYVCQHVTLPPASMTLFLPHCLGTVLLTPQPLFQSPAHIRLTKSLQPKNHTLGYDSYWWYFS